MNTSGPVFPYEILNLIFTKNSKLHLQSSAVNKIFRRLWHEKLARSLVLSPSRRELYHTTWPSMVNYDLSGVLVNDKWTFAMQGLERYLRCDTIRCNYSISTDLFKITFVPSCKIIVIPSIADCLLFNFDPSIFSHKMHLWNIWRRLNMSPSLFDQYIICQSVPDNVIPIIEEYKKWRGAAQYL